MPSTADMIAGESEVSSQATLDEGSLAKPTTCPKLDSALSQVAASSDPLETAKNLNLRVEQDKIQVSLLLAGDDPSFLKEFGIEPGSQAGQEIQAFVPINQLCEIAKMEEVITIRIPAEVMLP